MPAFLQSALYLDPTGSPAYLRHVIHHEFFHMVDYFDDGQLYVDAEWLDLNPSGFTYAKQGRARPWRWSRNPFPVGFVTEYATFGVEEDNAETFAWLMTRREALEVRTQNDRHLAAKVAVLRAYVRRFCPEMNREYWERAASRPARQ